MRGQLAVLALDETACCEQCAGKLFSEHEWQAFGRAPAGHSDVAMVRSPTGEKGFAKPALEKPGMPAGAHEKISADLAFQVGVPVPGVVLWDRAEDGAQFCVSMNAFRQSFRWRQVANRVSDEFHFRCRDVFALGAVFHTWIGDTDHNGHPDNVLVDGASIENPRLAFIDHAHSLSRSWAVRKEPVKRLSAYYCPLDDLPRNALIDAVDRVLQVNEEQVARIVDRIPEGYLEARRRELVISNLVGRREQLGALFGLD